MTFSFGDSSVLKIRVWVFGVDTCSCLWLRPVTQNFPVAGVDVDHDD